MTNSAEPSIEKTQTEQQVVEQQNEPPDTERPLWQRQDIDPDLKKQALRALFKKTEFGVLDGLNEYDEDFTQFTHLGDIIPHDMKRMIQLANENTQLETQSIETSELDLDEADERALEQNTAPKQKEDDNLA